MRGHNPLGYSGGACAEIRATWGRDPSAGPGAKTGEGGTMPPQGLPRMARKPYIHSCVFFSVTSLACDAVCPISAEPTHAARGG